MLQDVRKLAGFNTANDAAKALGMPKTTYSRYERDSSKVPMSAAIELADFFGCSLDEIAGREKASRITPGGGIARRFDALPSDLQGFVLSSLEYAEKTNTERLKERDALAEARALKLEAQFALSLESRGKEDVVLFGTPEELRDKFEDYLSRRAAAATKNPKHAKEVVAEIMAAYDRSHPIAEGRVECAVIDL